jgi:hypothetical protein
MTDFFNHPQRVQLLPYLHHMEHGIKVTKDKVITHKYNFGVNAHNLDINLMKQCLASVKYPHHIINEIINYIQTSFHPYSGFGVEDDKIEFYVESNQKIRSWNLDTQDQFIYQKIDPPSAFNFIERYTDKIIFDTCKLLMDDIFFIYNKHSYNKPPKDVFSLYFKHKRPQKVHDVMDVLLNMLHHINKSATIEQYFNRYHNWYLCWLHVSIKNNGVLQVTPYLRSQPY